MKRGREEQDNNIPLVCTIPELTFKICAVNIHRIVFTSSFRDAHQCIIGIRSFLRTCKATFGMIASINERIKKGLSGLLKMTKDQHVAHMLALEDLQSTCRDVRFYHNDDGDVGVGIPTLNQLTQLFEEQAKVERIAEKLVELKNLLQGL